MSDTTKTLPTPSATSARTLVNYSTDNGVAVIELTNLPANTYSHEMMSQLDDRDPQGARSGPLLHRMPPARA